MTKERQQVLESYEIEGDRIRSPGKFEGEPVFAPHFWGLAMEGFADDEYDDGSFAFHIPRGDDARVEWPELDRFLGGNQHFRMIQNDQGFIFTKL